MANIIPPVIVDPNSTGSLTPAGYISSPILLGLTSYIAGLFEGDGHIRIPATTRSPSVFASISYYFRLEGLSIGTVPK